MIQSERSQFLTTKDGFSLDDWTFFEIDREFCFNTWGITSWLPHCFRRWQMDIFEETYKLTERFNKSLRGNGFGPIFNYWDSRRR